MKKKKFLLIGLISILLVLLLSGVFLLNNPSVDNLRVTNISSNSATISWETEDDVVGKVLVKRNNTWTPIDGLINSGEEHYDDRDIELNSEGEYVKKEFNGRTIHHVTVRKLNPEQEYFFRVDTGSKIVDAEINSFTTAPVQESFPSPKTIVGKAALINGAAPTNGVVYYQVIGTNPEDVQSQPISPTGTFSLDISTQLQKLEPDNGEIPVNIDSPEVTIDIISDSGSIKLDYTFPADLTEAFADIGTLVLEPIDESLINDISVSDEQECVWSCNGACAYPPDVKNFNDAHNGNGYCNWMYEAGCGACAPEEETHNNDNGGSSGGQPATGGGGGGACIQPGESKSNWSDCDQSCGMSACDGNGPLQCYRTSAGDKCLTDESYNALISGGNDNSGNTGGSGETGGNGTGGNEGSGGGTSTGPSCAQQCLQQLEDGTGGDIGTAQCQRNCEAAGGGGTAPSTTRCWYINGSACTIKTVFNRDCRTSEGEYPMSQSNRCSRDARAATEVEPRPACNGFWVVGNSCNNPNAGVIQNYTNSEGLLEVCCRTNSSGGGDDQGNNSDEGMENQRPACNGYWVVGNSCNNPNAGVIQSFTNSNGQGEVCCRTNPSDGGSSQGGNQDNNEPEVTVPRNRTCFVEDEDSLEGSCFSVNESELDQYGESQCMLDQRVCINIANANAARRRQAQGEEEEVPLLPSEENAGDDEDTDGGGAQNSNTCRDNAGVASCQGEAVGHTYESNGETFECYIYQPENPTYNYCLGSLISESNISPGDEEEDTSEETDGETLGPCNSDDVCQSVPRRDDATCLNGTIPSVCCPPNNRISFIGSDVFCAPIPEEEPITQTQSQITCNSGDIVEANRSQCTAFFGSNNADYAEFEVNGNSVTCVFFNADGNEVGRQTIVFRGCNNEGFSRNNTNYSPFNFVVPKVSAQTDDDPPAPEIIDPTLLQKGLYVVEVPGYETAEFEIFYDNIRVSYFEDQNADGIKQANEPNLDPNIYEIKLSQTASIATRELSRGWNLLGFEIFSEEYDSAAELISYLADQGIFVEQISQYDSGNWIHFIQTTNSVGQPEVYGASFNLVPGKSYFVRSLSTGTAAFKGQEFTSSVPIKLNTGWNLVSIQSAVNYTAQTVLQLCGANSIFCTNVSQWIDGAGYYDSYESVDGTSFGNNFIIYENRGYFIKVESDGSFTINP